MVTAAVGFPLSLPLAFGGSGESGGRMMYVVGCLFGRQLVVSRLPVVML